MVVIQEEFLKSSRKFFLYYKELGEKAMLQLEDKQLFFTPSAGGNSIAVIVQHMAGNMHSRWTGFPDTDGESASRNRDAEFELHLRTREELLLSWKSGWKVVFAALERVDTILELVLIRGEQITVLEAIERQVAHYAHHVGQIVFLAKMIRGPNFVSLSVPRGGSAAFNDVTKRENQT